MNKNIDFEKFSQETIKQLTSHIINESPYPEQLIKTLVEQSAVVCKLMLEKYHNELSQD
ncbi:MAG: hypothetical protein ACRCXX_09800 [Cetobacterium sp.]|uniref:hypothetical protein n=1 Tax=Cetobacterium sp. TaxID=2071632 RepID=UPI003F2F9D4C